MFDKNRQTNMRAEVKNTVYRPSGIYGLGFIGAVIYFIQNATSFGVGVLGVFKALVWPAVIVYKALEFMKV
jgi:hypothetical protein